MAKPGDAPNGANAASREEESAISLPPIAAAFLVQFDNRKGYTLAWHQQLDELNIEGVVEFKSLPSGLHKVKEDLVYFTHEQYAGISAFLNREDEENCRKARMLAIGVMVPIESGRMGKSWLHAEQLKELTRKQFDEQDDFSLLEAYWKEHMIQTFTEQEETSGSSSKKQPDLSISIPSQPMGYKSSTSMNPDATQAVASHPLPAHHPALALPDLLHTFGPLMFPLLRASLLRKRILILGEAPVERTCNFVYNLSVLSSLSRDVTSTIPLDETGDLHLRPLFNVGISDIPLLENNESGQGWIGCTTDDVLCTKPELFDLLVILPNASTIAGRRFPKLILSSPELSKAQPKLGMKASQRDARRYVTLSKGLRVIPPSSASNQDPAVESAIVDDDNENEDLLETASTTSSAPSTYSRTSIVEPQSWSRIAYTSLIWWASAGDKSAGFSETEANEIDQDATLLDFQDPDDGPMSDAQEADAKTKEVVTVAYFHRLTELIFRTLGDAVARTTNSNEDGTERYTDHDDQQDEGASHDQAALLSNQHQQNVNEKDAPVEISQDDVATMGLDLWSTSDQKFIEEMVSFWWGREAIVRGGRVECCGIRIL